MNNERPQTVRIRRQRLPAGRVPPLTNAELVQLQTRVIALENLAIALLAQASQDQLELARGMAAYISPRAGSTAHPLTLHAAAQMRHLVERAHRFRAAQCPVQCP